MDTVAEEFVNFQENLTSVFRAAYPSANDFEFLLDFPKSGVVKHLGAEWQFIKHGVGLKFIRLSPAPHLVIDIHNNFGQTRFTDDWRLKQFNESRAGRRVIGDAPRLI